MVAVPVLTPVTTPPLLTVATAVLLLLHVPPVVALLRVTDEPGQVLLRPVMAATVGVVWMVTVVVAAAVHAPLVTV